MHTNQQFPDSQPPSSRSWRALVAPYENPSRWRSARQICTSFIPYLALWALMMRTIEFSYLLTLGLGIVAAGFLTRIFIISHDCGHGSFFRSEGANRFWGVSSGILTMIPYHFWRREHARHHGTAGNLDRRGCGDIWTLTVDEYRSSGWWTRLSYRLYRNPIVMFFIGAPLIFLLRYRFPTGTRDRSERLSVLWTNVGIMCIACAMVHAIGLWHFLAILLMVIVPAGAAGVWLFYVQHQFEGVYWSRNDQWDFVAQALEGSSFYRLPRILQWFTGNIGFHHIHHLSPRIPNYNLERCHRENTLFQRVSPITLLSSLKSLRFRLWDERARRLIHYREMHRA
jgi:omega-6 fatty acid desaturase (delta-12 desaturase)